MVISLFKKNRFEPQSSAYAFLWTKLGFMPNFKFIKGTRMPKIEAQIDFFKQANDYRDINVPINQAGRSDIHPVHRISLAIADLQSQ